MFSPTSVRDIPCDISDLQSLRKTIVMDEHKRTIKSKVDEWASGSTKLQHEAWIGETRFYLKEKEGSVFQALKPEDIETELLGSGEISGIPLPTAPKTSGGLLSEDFSDFWESKGRCWIRHHVRPRSSLFIPQENSAGGPDVTMLSSIRETRFIGSKIPAPTPPFAKKP